MSCGSPNSLECPLGGIHPKLEKNPKLAAALLAHTGAEADVDSILETVHARRGFHALNSAAR